MEGIILKKPSSYIIKYLIFKNKILQSIREMITSRSMYKPLFISCLSDTSGKRYYTYISNTYGDGKGQKFELAELREGEEYTARVSVLFSYPRSMDVVYDLLKEQANSVDDVFEAYGRRVKVSLIEFRGMYAKNVGVELSEMFRIRFATPVILSPKHLMPRNTKLKEAFKSIHARAAFPTPHLLCMYSINLWNKHMPPEHRIPKPGDEVDGVKLTPYKLCMILGSLVSHSVDASEGLEGEKVPIGKDKNGRERIVIGHRGAIILHMLDIKIGSYTSKEIMKKLLGLSLHLGVGRGRGIGMGEIASIHSIDFSSTEGSTPSP